LLRHDSKGASLKTSGTKFSAARFARLEQGVMAIIAVKCPQRLKPSLSIVVRPT